MNTKKLTTGLMSLLLGASSLCLQAANTYEKNEFESFMQKIRQDFMTNPSIDEALNHYNEKDGSFDDVDYASIQRTHWPPLVHVERISDFVYAYTNPQNKYYKDPSLYGKIVKGLTYWHERNPWCHNWWYNQIAEPQLLGVLLIQMRSGEKKLPKELEQKILERMKTDGGDPAKWTGANRTDIALHWIYRSCLSADAESLNYAMENVYSPIVYTTKEGFQHDNSNFQHGQQLYIGGYGDEILKGVTQVAMYAHGTRFAIPAEKLRIISKFMRETYYPSIRGKYMLFNVMGRSISRPGTPDKSSTALFAQRMQVLDEKHTAEYQEIIDRLKEKQPAHHAVRPVHTHYFRGDYTLHVRPNYTFDVRMVSNRTIRCEYGNGENLKTYFMSDGSTCLVLNGDEYDGIYPVWNWARIPGTTAPQFTEIPKAANDWQTPGTSTFAGGVSDSLYGVSVYKYIDKYKNIRTGAQKAWFFFDDEIVCLGAGISSAADEKVYTTVNQSLARQGTAQVTAKGITTAIPSGETVYTDPEYIMHGGIGYVFPQGGNVCISNQAQSGTWYEINNSINDKNEVKKDVFTLCIDHGRQPTAGSYAYIIVPDKHSAVELKKHLKKNQIEICSNNERLQAVRNHQLDIWQMVFYEAGKYTDKAVCIEADRPCTVMLKDKGKKKYEVHIADPGQTGKPVNVKFTFAGKKKETHTICFFPDKDPTYAGATRSYTIKR